jgi:hypothetical protein
MKTTPVVERGLAPAERERVWPSLPYEDWKETCRTLHLWTQVPGKIKLALEPMLNQWWQVALQVSVRGLTTGFIPYRTRAFEMEFDFQEERLRTRTTDGELRELELRPRTVAEFYREVMKTLRELKLEAQIFTTPQEVPDPIPFEKDEVHSAYDAGYAERFWRLLLQVNRLLNLFRGEFTGKASSPILFWGSFDLCHTRFSGRLAPPHPPSPLLAQHVIQEAYAEEEYTVGFWPGNEQVPEASFYAYIYPEPPGLKEAPVRPEGARYRSELGEFLLPYEAVRRAADPDLAVLEFARSTYQAAATLGGWDRRRLERKVPLTDPLPA